MLNPRSKGGPKRRKSDHDRILAEYPHPPWLVGGTLLSNRWTVRLTNPDKVRNSDKVICFDVPASPGKLFTDPLYESDLLTVKLLVVHPIRDGVIGTGQVASIYVRNYLQFARWRIGLGLRQNSGLSESLFAKLLRDLRERGILGLPPIDKALSEYETELKAGQRTLPSYAKGNLRYLSSDALAQELGVPNTRSAPSHIRMRIWELGSSNGLSLHKIRSYSRDRSNDDGSSDLTVNRVAAFLKPVEALFTYRHVLEHDALAAPPFGSKSAQAAAASVTQRDAGRTPTIPSYQACYLVNQALLWVLEYGPELFRCLDDAQKRFQRLKGDHWRPHERAIKDALDSFVPRCATGCPGSPFPLHPSYYQPTSSSEGRPSLRTAILDHLAIACFIVIATFAVRRREEINSLRDDCIVDTEFGLLLRSYIEKTLQDDDQIPVPVAVKAAIDVLTRLSAEYRERTGEPWIVSISELLPVRCGIGDIQPDEAIKKGQLDLYRLLFNFAAFIEFPLLDDGTMWIPRPHQFRRWFGIVYMNRYRYPHLLALSYLYRHFDINQTRRYATEKVYGGLIREKDKARARENLRDLELAGREYRTERFLNVVAGTESLTGYGGEKLKRDLKRSIDRMSDQLQVSDPKKRKLTLIEAIAPVVKRTRLENNELGISSCSFKDPKSDAALAECIKKAAVDGIEGGREPDPAYATAETCGDCIFGCFFEENENAIGLLIRRLQRSRDSCKRQSEYDYYSDRLAPLIEQRDRRKAQERRL